MRAYVVTARFARNGKLDVVYLTANTGDLSAPLWVDDVEAAAIFATERKARNTLHSLGDPFRTAGDAIAAKLGRPVPLDCLTVGVRAINR